ncbi:hypothetical protein F4814DRAFT_461231 [Daldinia grandis]|nr:hypothetical protein F4814DRAFT_461231 [Daldinia grandis]
METNLASQPDNPSLTNYGNRASANVGINTSPSKPRDLTDLPLDLFVIIAQLLAPQDIILSRRVSRAWHAAFTDPTASYRFATRHFPRSREILRARLPGAAPAPVPEMEIDWARVFATVARRYFHLRAARPRRVEKIATAAAVARDGDGGVLAVRPWDRWLRWDARTAPFQYPDPMWAVAEGVLVYCERGPRRWVVRDLETGRVFGVPFEGTGMGTGTGRVVRRLRLAGGVLVFEWCEKVEGVEGGELDMWRVVRRHFATAFDVRRRYGEGEEEGEGGLEEDRGEWDITFRCEWDIVVAPGLPLGDNDRFFSAHTATHYALYLWQPDQSPWTSDPFEQLAVWDISQPSPHRPSLDPGDANKRVPGGPALIKRFSQRDLEFLGLRQRDAPSVRAIHLDGANVYVHAEEHRWLAGPHASLSPPRHHQVRSTGVPFRGAGPRWFDECCGDGDVHMSFCPRAGSLARTMGNGRGCGGGGGGGGEGRAWPGWAPCWRHEEFPYLTVSDAVDGRAGVRVVARQCFVVEALSSFVVPRISVVEEGGAVMGVQAGVGEGEGEGEGIGEEEEKGERELVTEVRFADEMWWELMGRGKIAGDERWVVGEDGDGRITIVRF